jgi:hypothetical protein
MGDALEEYAQVQVLEAMADESEMGDADYEEWFQFINEGLQAEELELWNDFWNDKERA